MNKKEFIDKVIDTLSENDIRKPVSIKKSTFRITDSDGTTADFDVKRQDKRVLYTSKDVTNIIDACISVIMDAIKTGDEIMIRGLGTLFLNKRAERRLKEPGTDKWHVVAAHYLPKFIPGKELKMAAKVYELSEADKAAAPKLPDPVYDEYD